MRLSHLNHIFKIDWAVTLNLELLLIGFADLKSFAHLYERREELILL